MYADIEVTLQGCERDFLLEGATSLVRSIAPSAVSRLGAQYSQRY